MSDWNFGQIDLSTVEAGGGSSRLQPGVHDVVCREAKLEDIVGTKNKKLVVDFDAQDGSGDIRHNFNVKHTSTQAMEIAMRQLKSFLVSAHHPNPDQPKDIGTLKGLKCKIRVGMGKPWKGTDGVERQTSEIKSFMPLGDSSQPTSTGASDTNLDDDIPF